MSKSPTTLPSIRPDASFPLWLKITAKLFLGVFVFSSWTNYGLRNFLWFSCIGVIGTVAALWLESPLLASMMLLATLMADKVAWGGDFLVRLFTGWYPLGATFDPRISRLSRAVSFYHFVFPLLLLWMVYRLRYDRRALVQNPFLSLLPQIRRGPSKRITHARNPQSRKSLVVISLFIFI